MATPRSPAGKSSGAGSEKSKQTPAPLAGVCGPITPEDNLVARTFSYVHVAVVLSSYYLNFSNLVANPVKTLAVSLVSLAVMQLLYLMLCLPLSTPSTRQRRSAGGPRPGGAGAPGTGPGAGASDVAYVQKAFAAVYSIILTLALATPVLYLLTILLGGPFLSHTPHTLLLAAHTAMLASPGLFYVHGVDRSAWTRVVALQQPLDEVSGAALGAVVGAWVGAVPIPLDWDREWQAWPVTVVTGAYVGWAVGRAAGGSVWWGRKLAMQ